MQLIWRSRPHSWLYHTNSGCLCNAGYAANLHCISQYHRLELNNSQLKVLFREVDMVEFSTASVSASLILYDMSCNNYNYFQFIRVSKLLSFNCSSVQQANRGSSLMDKSAALACLPGSILGKYGCADWCDFTVNFIQFSKKIKAQHLLPPIITTLIVHRESKAFFRSRKNVNSRCTHFCLITRKGREHVSSICVLNWHANSSENDYSMSLFISYSGHKNTNECFSSLAHYQS